MIRIAMSGTEYEHDDPIDMLLASAVENAVDYLEIWWPKNTSADGLGKTLEKIRDAGRRIACISTGSELYRKGGSLSDQDLLSEAIRLASAVGAPFVNTYFGYADRCHDDQAIGIYCRYLDPCLNLASALRVTILLENEFNAFGWDPCRSDITRRPESLLKLMRAINSPYFRVNFDPANYVCAGVEPYPYAYKILRDYIAYVHVKDVIEVASTSDADTMRWRVYTDYGRSYRTCEMGLGEVRWPNLLEALCADGFEGFLTLEPHPAATHEASAFRDAASRVRSLLQTDGGD